MGKSTTRKTNTKNTNKQNAERIRGGKAPRTVNCGLTPDRISLQLKYSDVVSIASVGENALHTWSLNSLHDPDYSATGHQPQYYDQWFNTVEGNGLYHKYFVKSMSYEITVVNSKAAESNVCVLPTTHGNLPDTSDSFNAMCEAPWAQVCTLGPDTSGNNSYVFRGKIGIAALEGVNFLDPSSYQGTYGSSPGFQPLLTVVVRAVTGSPDVSCRVKLTYHTDGYDRIYRSADN